MRYDVSELAERPGCKIIAVDDMNTADAVERSILESYPKHNAEINGVFSSWKKFGPFRRKNKTRLWDILRKSADVKKNGPEVLIKHMQDVELFCYDRRMPWVLTAAQKKRASIMYDAMNGVRSFFINDCFMIDEGGKRMSASEKEFFLSMISWLKAYGERLGERFDLIWMTDLPPRKIVQALGDEKFASAFYSVHKVIDNKVTCIDKDSFDGEFRRRRHAKLAFEEGKAYDFFSGINKKAVWSLDEIAAEAEKAFPLYKIAAEEGHSGAQYGLGCLYSRGLGGCERDEEKALYWYAMAAFNEDHDKRTADPLLKECRERALVCLKPLVVNIANGKALLRKYAGDRAEALIKEAEQEKKIQAAVDALNQSFDHEGFWRDMDEIRKKVHEK